MNGDDSHSVYKFLRACYPGDITWNFSSKFLINRVGAVVARFELEGWHAIEDAIVALL